jgi:ATP-binding cassette subfamily B multidrug efflux pump
MGSHWRGYACGLLVAPFSVAAGLAVPYLTGEAVAVLQNPQHEGSELSTLLYWILATSIVGGLTLFAVRYLIIGASRRVEFDLRNHLFRHLLSLDQLYFKSARTGDIMARATADVDSCRTVAGPVILYTARTLLLLAAAIPLMLSVSWVLTACILLPLSLLTLAVRVIGPRVHAGVLKSQETFSELSSTAQEDFSGVRVVKSFAQEANEIARFTDVASRYLERNVKVARLQAWMHPIIAGVDSVSFMALLFVGGSLMLYHGLELKEFVKFTGYLAYLLWPMVAMGWVVNQFHRGSASVERLKAVFAVQPRIAEPTRPLVPTSGTIDGHISIRNLNFHFNYGQQRVLTNISLEVPNGKTVAIVGRTGAGKSTLISLIPRIYPVPDNTIFIDGVDVNRLPLKMLRGSIGFVPQESFLFSRTISENIAFGVEETNPDDVYGVAELTRFGNDIDQFPRGYEEVVGERGVTLSGGQKQRAAMSRALLVKPKILILDDALSAVDTQTEEEIITNLKRSTKDLTTLVVAHRISSIQHADRIYVLERGGIVEEGSHDELLRNKGIYAEIYQMQLISDELEHL